MKIKRYIADIQKFQNLDFPSSKSKIILNDFRKQKIEPESIDFIITSPPSGIASISYLRTHMLSYRVLHNVLKTSVDELKNKMIGSDFILNCELKSNAMVSKIAKNFLDDFKPETNSSASALS